MLLEMIKNEPMIDSYKKALCVGEPFKGYEPPDSVCHTAMGVREMHHLNQDGEIGGYSNKPLSPYVKELMEKYGPHIKE